jgi:hypothetical protein
MLSIARLYKYLCNCFFVYRKGAVRKENNHFFCVFRVRLQTPIREVKSETFVNAFFLLLNEHISNLDLFYFIFEKILIILIGNKNFFAPALFLLFKLAHIRVRNLTRKKVFRYYKFQMFGQSPGKKIKIPYFLLTNIFLGLEQFLL